jgi:hypothetical protein
MRVVAANIVFDARNVRSPCSAHRISCYNPAPLQHKYFVVLKFSRARSQVAAYPLPAATESGGAMTFYDPTLYGRDEEEEFGDSGAYSESLEEDFEEEEEEEEEPGIPEAESEPEPEPVPAPPAPKPAAPSGGGGGGARKKAAKKKSAPKKKAKKPAKKAKKPAKKKAKKAAKKPAKKKGKKRR